MPQLDKYIFLSQIVYLTFFFFLIYVYLRSTVIPNFSSLFKYRKYKINEYHINIIEDTKAADINKKNFEKNIKDFFSSINTINNNLSLFLDLHIINQSKNLRNNLNYFSNDTNLFNIRNKLKSENKRLNSL